MTNTDRLAEALASGNSHSQAVAIERLIAWSIQAATGRTVPEPVVQRSVTTQVYRD